MVIRDFDLNCPGQTFQMATLASKDWRNTNITIAIRLKVRHFPSNGFTANVIRHDLNLRCHSHEFGNVNISKMVRASEKYTYHFIQVDICHPVGPLRLLDFITFTFIFKIKHVLVMHWL